MSTNNRISTVVSGQLPEFVRADHPVFVSFLEAYYEYLEQSNTTLNLGKTVERAKNLTKYYDIDRINELDDFLISSNTKYPSEFYYELTPLLYDNSFDPIGGDFVTDSTTFSGTTIIKVHKDGWEDYSDGGPAVDYSETLRKFTSRPPDLIVYDSNDFLKYVTYRVSSFKENISSYEMSVSFVSKSDTSSTTWDPGLSTIYGFSFNPNFKSGSGILKFADKLYAEFLSLMPQEVAADKTILLKNIKNFYRARGTEKAYSFLMKSLFNETPEFYYPKNDILIASSGKWVVDKVIRLSNIKYNGVANSSIELLKRFQNASIKGNTSLTVGNIERAQQITESGLLYKELFLSKLNGDFALDEEVFSINTDGDVLTANLLSGFVSSIVVVNSGTGYVVGTAVPLESVTGTGAVATISSVSTGNISGIIVVEGGAGFQVNNFVLFSNPSGFSGITANAKVISVLADNSVHPNTYILVSNVISDLKDTQINLYSNGSGGNANTSLGNTLTFFALSNLGPVQGVLVESAGSGYTLAPVANVVGNTTLRSLGIIGKIKINGGGSGYADGEILKFRNVLGGYGSGANGFVTVNGTGSIVSINLTPQSDGLFVGGSGYELSFLPTVEVETSSGTGANLEVQTLLGFGDILNVTGTGSIGQILSIRIDSAGSGYIIAPTVNLSSIGDGTATAVANVATGFLVKPGRYLDDTGKLSSTNYLQNRDYYQRFSYVIKLSQSIAKYKKYLLDLVHPAGMKLWAEFLYDSEPDVEMNILAANSNLTFFETYTANSISFNGTNSTLYKNTSMNTTNSMSGTLSFWFNPRTLSNDQIIFGIANSSSLLDRKGITVYLTDKGSGVQNSVIKIIGKNASDDTVLEISTNTRNKIIPNTWNHILAGWDLRGSSNANCIIYLNGVNSTNLITRATAETNVNYTGANVYISGTPEGNNRFKGCLSEFWFANTYANVRNSTIRSYFAGNTESIYPKNLGVSGDIGTNIFPVIYIRSNYLNADINSGTGGNFYYANNITSCDSSPSDV